MHYKGFHHVNDDPLRTLLVQNFVTGCSAAGNRALIELASPVPRIAQMHDYWYALCAATFGELAYLPRPTLNYRQHSANNLGARRRTILPNLSRLALNRAWRDGLALFEQRIAQARALSEVADRHPYVNHGAQTAIADFLHIFDAPTRIGRLVRAARSRIRCQRGVAYNILMYAQIMCARV